SRVRWAARGDTRRSAPAGSSRLMPRQASSLDRRRRRPAILSQQRIWVGSSGRALWATVVVGIDRVALGPTPHLHGRLAHGPRHRRDVALVYLEQRDHLRAALLVGRFEQLLGGGAGRRWLDSNGRHAAYRSGQMVELDRPLRQNRRRGQRLLELANIQRPFV